MKLIRRNIVFSTVFILNMSLALPVLLAEEATKSTSKSDEASASVTLQTESNSSEEKDIQSAGGSNLSAETTRFIKEAAKGGLMEVELGKLASQKAQSPEVKNFAERMVRDHSKANDELVKLAAKKGITLSTNQASASAHLDHLKNLSGAEFDRAYMQHMLSDHQKDISEFERASSDKDPDVSAFAKTTLPTLKEHLRIAREVSQSATAGTVTSEGAGASISDSDKSGSTSGPESGKTGTDRAILPSTPPSPAK